MRWVVLAALYPVARWARDGFAARKWAIGVLSAFAIAVLVLVASPLSASEQELREAREMAAWVVEDTNCAGWFSDDCDEEDWRAYLAARSLLLYIDGVLSKDGNKSAWFAYGEPGDQSVARWAAAHRRWAKSLAAGNARGGQALGFTRECSMSRNCISALTE